MKAIIVNIALFGLVAAGVAHGGDKDKTPAKLEQKVVDSGSFGIFMSGKRIGTETFKIEQRPDYGVVTAEIKVNDGKMESVQNSEMRVSPNGDLRSYTWHSTLPAVEEAIVEPQNEFLVEHMVLADQKKKDIPHLVSPNTAILDNNFFSQREVLLWRYLRTGCAEKNGQLMCGPSSYAVLVPQDHSSASAVLNFLGADKVSVNGAERTLNKVSLQLGEPKQMVVMNGSSDSDGGQWLLWVDDQYKIVKITIIGTGLEVVRD